MVARLNAGRDVSRALIVQRISRIVVSFCLVMIPLGCSGGGGGGSAVDPGAPVADAGLDRVLSISDQERQTIALNGTYSSGEGTIAAHRWIQVSGPPVELAGADTPTVTFSVPAQTEAYTFSYTVTDSRGAVATDSVSVYIARIIVADSFADGYTWRTRWTPVDDTGLGAGWATSIPEGQLSQTLNNTAFHQPTSYHLGTYALLTSDIPPSYRFSVDIKPLPATTGSRGNDVGIMFGYKDPGNYYRLSMNARYGFTRFEKRANGIFQTLAVNAVGYIERQALNMTAEVDGSAIMIWIDGDPLFAVVDSSPSSGTVALYCQSSAVFDNVLVTENSLQPKLVLSKPIADSIALVPDRGDTLAAEAVVLNPPEGGSVLFSLSDQVGVPKGTAPGTYSAGIFSAVFDGLAAGEYVLTAVLKDGAGRQVSSDKNSMVGIGGDYHITLGDSITQGVGDQDPSNNESWDGRIVSIQGYQAELSNALTTAGGRPTIVFNEGIEGERASGLKQRVDSILERHPGANNVLLMIGTNDANARVPPDAFESDVWATLSKMNGRNVWLAKPMPTFKINTWEPDTTRNGFIQQYNDKISAIALTDPFAFAGPDFYAIFSSLIDQNLYADYLHPNDDGYSVMASGWGAVLNP